MLVLVELNVVEQRYQAVLEVLNQGASVTDVARRSGVSRQTVHSWLRKYATHGLAGLADGSAKPLSCPHQMTPEVEVSSSSPVGSSALTTTGRLARARRDRRGLLRPTATQGGRSRDR